MDVPSIKLPQVFFPPLLKCCCFVLLAASQAAAQARGQSSQQSAAASSITGMSLQEAQQILNISTLSPEEIQKVAMTLRLLSVTLLFEFPSDEQKAWFTLLFNKVAEVTDLSAFVCFRTTITFSKSMTSQWAVHFTFSQKWVTSTAKIFSFYHFFFFFFWWIQFENQVKMKLLSVTLLRRWCEPRSVWKRN